MGLTTSYLRSAATHTVTLSAGIAAAAVAFSVLSMHAAAATVQITGPIPPVSPGRVYDILVRSAGSALQDADATTLARPSDLTDISGGITLAQYDVIRRLPGVQVAAPMTMVGYVPLTASMRVTIPAAATGRRQPQFAVTALFRSDNGLTTVTQRTIGTGYFSGRGVGAGREGGRRPALLPVAVPGQVRWTFLLPLVAVDPAAEADLLHLDRAVVRGSYLPNAVAAHHGPIPMIVASSIDDGEQCTLTVARVPARASRLFGRGRTTGQIESLLAATTGHAVGTRTITAAQAYQVLLGSLRGPTVTPVSAYWTTTPAQFALSADGDLVPQPVVDGASTAVTGPYLRTAVASASAGGRGIAFQKLIPHVAGGAGTSHRPLAGAALLAVGTFDPGKVSQPGTPSPYAGERLAGADAASRKLLGGQPLSPTGPSGYPSAAASLVMPLQDIAAFAGYPGADIAAPIGSIRVRVAGASADDALSRERVRAVATEIVRATGLDVDLAFTATAVTRTIDLVASRNGRPALRVHEVWYRNEPRTTVASVLDPRRVALAVLVLLVGAAFVANGGKQAVGMRRSELVTLRALGWQRRRIRRRVVAEFALTALASGLLAVMTVGAAAAVLDRDSPSGWALLAMPAAFAMTAAGARGRSGRPWRRRS